MKDGLLKQQDVSEQDKRWKNGDLIEHKSQIILFSVWLWRDMHSSIRLVSYPNGRDVTKKSILSLTHVFAL